MAKKKQRLFVVGLEPTPYNIDLWNAFAQCEDWNLFVLYTKENNWSRKEGGHDFREFPEPLFSHTMLSGNGLAASLVRTIRFIRLFTKLRPGLTILAGYYGALPALAIFLCVMNRRPYALTVDQFNTDGPNRRGLIAFCAREILRRIILRSASFVLASGREGCFSAIKAGCSRHKVFDFPYVVDAKRLETQQPEATPNGCGQDVDSGKLVLLYSGRLVPRKGLVTLLEALALLVKEERWVCWIEGDGPMRSQYLEVAQRLGIADRCRFLGFCQMRLHSWLLRRADIVIVPSVHDNWGIVVDEGMQMGKAVVASRATGSALDRIIHQQNGLLFTPEDSAELSRLLRSLLADADLRRVLGQRARASARKWSPLKNVEVFRQAIKEIE